MAYQFPAHLVDHEAKNIRFQRTLRFMAQSMPPPARILDIGGPNPFAEIMNLQGYEVQNTEGDLDESPEIAHGFDTDAATAFEILEHLVSPMPLLRQISAPRLFATIPTRLWFAKAYNNPDDPWDRHYHEFEPWQFDWLLEKGGWKVIRTEQWTSHATGIGIRPLLRRITPRYYAVEAIRA